jgi:hypothetical protein
MKNTLMKYLFWLNLSFLVLPLIYLLPQLQGLENTNTYLAVVILLTTTVLNFLSVMLIVFVLFGVYGKGVAITGFTLWIIVASYGSVGMVASIVVTSGYWISLRSYINRYIEEFIEPNKPT